MDGRGAVGAVQHLCSAIVAVYSVGAVGGAMDGRGAMEMSAASCPMGAMDGAIGAMDDIRSIHPSIIAPLPSSSPPLRTERNCSVSSMRSL